MSCLSCSVPCLYHLEKLGVNGRGVGMPCLSCSVPCLYQLEKPEVDGRGVGMYGCVAEGVGTCLAGLECIAGVQCIITRVACAQEQHIPQQIKDIQQQEQINPLNAPWLAFP